MKVLVTDDCGTIQSLYELVMHATHVDSVMYASNAAETCAYAERNDYDAVFLDIELQSERRGGIKILKKIRKLLPENTPIYMVSTVTDRSTIQDCLQYGATAFIEKGEFFFRDVSAAIGKVKRNLASYNQSRLVSP